ncbi:MAG: 2-dehydropantoate 2-reductase [Candidatus Marinimicrobia bacterium]|nr:2-dehydropantoate 2-reductase [Candidatus Neomarinimicrobiota bacterium]
MNSLNLRNKPDSEKNMITNTNTQLRIGVVGAGPVGLTLSAHLIEAGAFVVICDILTGKMDKIKRSGIKLTHTIHKQIPADHVCCSIDDLAAYDLDLVVVSVKTTALKIVVDQLSQIDSGKMFIMCAQNGIDNELIAAEKFGIDKTLRMVINYAGGMENLNTVDVTFFNPPNHLAALAEEGKSIAEKFTALLNSVKLDTETCASNEIQYHVWEKAILNAALSGLCAISHRTMKEVMSFSETVDIVTGIIDESIQVAKKENIEIRDGFRDDGIRYLKKAGHHKPSMLIDIENGLKTEIDQLNGKIVEYGKKHDINTPLNQAVTALIHLQERKEND